jgi:hypothetical protein
MIWIFTRGTESRRIETRVDSATGEYLLIRDSDSDPQIERFSDQETLEAAWPSWNTR